MKVWGVGCGGSSRLEFRLEDVSPTQVMLVKSQHFLAFFLPVKRKYQFISLSHILKIISDKKWQIDHPSFSKLCGIWKNEHFVICVCELI